MNIYVAVSSKRMYQSSTLLSMHMQQISYLLTVVHGVNLEPALSLLTLSSRTAKWSFDWVAVGFMLYLDLRWIYLQAAVFSNQSEVEKVSQDPASHFSW